MLINFNESQVIVTKSTKKSLIWLRNQAVANKNLKQNILDNEKERHLGEWMTYDPGSRQAYKFEKFININTQLDKEFILYI